MGSLFHYLTLIYHQNQIGVADGGKSMGNDETGLVMHQGTLYGDLNLIILNRNDAAFVISITCCPWSTNNLITIRFM